MARSTSTPQVSAQRFCTSCGLAAGQGQFCGACGNALPPALYAAIPTQPEMGEQETIVLQRPVIDLDDRPTQSTELLPGVDWADEEPVVDGGTPFRRLDRRKGALIGGGVLVAGALIAGGITGQQYLADGDVRRALDSASTDFNGVVRALASASDLPQVTAAAEGADAAASRLQRVADGLNGDDRMRTAVRAQVESERAVLLSVAQLSTLASDPLKTWGAAHADLTQAMTAEQETRQALSGLDSGAVQDLASTAPVLSKVAAAVGPALVEDATDESTRLLKSLDSVAKTADLRKLGDAAAPEQVAVAAAAKALPEGDGRQVLTGYSSALASLAGLSKLTAESTGGWAATRAELAQTFGQVAASAGTSGANVRVVLDSALNSADGVVAAATAGIADWKAKTDAAVKARSADAEALSTYTSSFRAATKSYEQLRQDLSAHLKRGEDLANNVTYNEDYAFLSMAIAERRGVRDQLISSDVPAPVEGAHSAVVAAIDRSISAVQAAYDGLEQSQDCDYTEDCTYYMDTPGWQRFLSESDGISKAYSSAISKWDGAVASAKVTIEARKLPAKPEL